MPALTRRIMSEAMAEFTVSFLKCLADTSVDDRMQLIFEPVFKVYLGPITGKMADSIMTLTRTVDTLRKEYDSKNLVTRNLNQDVGQPPNDGKRQFRRYLPSNFYS